MSEFVVVLVTAASVTEAEKIARALVDAGASPCVNIVPSIFSIYRWEGEIRRDRECLMLIKSRSELFARVRARLHVTREETEIITRAVLRALRARISPAEAAIIDADLSPGLRTLWKE